MKNLFFFLTFLFAIAIQVIDLEAQTDATVNDTNFDSFGEKISPEAAQHVSEITQVMEKADSATTKIIGRVEEVCQVKGCWMTVTDVNENTSEPLFVKFKDYGFFMPKDLAGKEVIMEGVAYREITPVEELRHYAEDAGKSEADIAAITEPKEEVRFVAKGVLVKN